MGNDLYKRLAVAEADAMFENSKRLDVMIDGYQRACAEGDEESAADLCRRIRNKLLEESDARMCIDRMGLEIPTGTTFAEWEPFLAALGSNIGGAWGQYRQALRDIPEQPGFPFDVEFPEKPE